MALASAKMDLGQAEVDAVLREAERLASDVNISRRLAAGPVSSERT
jgi:hypothetical protein